jgi:hypothetical protein
VSDNSRLSKIEIAFRKVANARRSVDTAVSDAAREEALREYDRAIRDFRAARTDNPNDESPER